MPVNTGSKYRTTIKPCKFIRHFIIETSQTSAETFVQINLSFVHQFTISVSLYCPLFFHIILKCKDCFILVEFFNNGYLLYEGLFKWRINTALQTTNAKFLH